jgi:hypothetical protein
MTGSFATVWLRRRHAAAINENWLSPHHALAIKRFIPGG